jgi:hypothetical protein
LIFVSSHFSIYSRQNVYTIDCIFIERELFGRCTAQKSIPNSFSVTWDFEALKTLLSSVNRDFSLEMNN